MPSTYSPNLRIELIASGEQANTWGNTTNTNLGTLIEQAIAGLSSIDVTAGNVTLTAYNGASDQSRQMILNVTGTPGVARTLTAPSVSKVYVVVNNSTDDITIETATGIGVTISSGYSKFVFCDGTDFSDVTTEASVLAVEDLIVNGDATLGDALTDVITINGTVQPGVAISGSSSSDALRITQTGSGNALLVEDSANPDSTPFVIDSVGNIGQGLTSITTTGFTGGYIAKSSTAFGPQLVYENATNDANGPYYILQKGRAGAVVQSGDTLGNFQFRGFDGTNFVRGASIEVAVDGTPGTNDMPGRLVFSTTADGASSPTERMRIDNQGRVGIGGTAGADTQLQLLGTYATSGAVTRVVRANGTIPSSTTGTARIYGTEITTQAASFTVSSLQHFYAAQATLGLGSAVTNQYGFLAEASLTGATNNYGFYSNIASGSNRYNFYAAGTADNYFAGAVGIGANPAADNYNLRLGGSFKSSQYPVLCFADASVPSTAASGGAYVFRSQPRTDAASFSMSTLQHFTAEQGTFGAGSSITNQYGFFANSNLTGATNDYGFYSAIASGSGRYNFYAAGTADNYFAGSVGVGTTPISSTGIVLGKNITGGANAYGVYVNSSIQSDVTTSAQIFSSYPTTQATTFTLGSLIHYAANQNTLGAGATVTNQIGFYAYSGLTGATNNYGFYSNIASGSNRYNFYAAGTADNYFAGAVGIGALPGVYGAQFALASSSSTQPVAVSRNSTNDGFGSRWFWDKVRGSAIVQNGDELGSFFFRGYDGASFISAGQISFAVDGTPGTNDMPGRIIFSTTADGASSPTEKMRIDSAGSVGIGGTPSPWARIHVTGTYLSSGGVSIANYSTGAIPSATTSVAAGFWSEPSTQAATFTLGSVRHFTAHNLSIGAGSTVTNQYGFYANSSLTGATNNFGFFSNIASGSGRYNFYAAGTADNYFAGAIGVGDTALTGYTIKVGRSITGATNAVGMQTLSTIQSDVTSSALIFGSKPSTAAAAFTLGTLYHFIAEQGTVGAGSAVTNQMGFSVQPSLTGATNNYGFYSNIASGSGRYNFYAAGTADNYFAGKIGIGGEPTTFVSADIQGTYPAGSFTRGFRAAATIPSSVIGNARLFSTEAYTQAASFTLASLTHYLALQQTIGAGSTVTNQYGFSAETTLTGATNNYGFYSNIASGSGRYNFYAAGTADNYFAGNVKTEGTLAGGYSALSAGTTAMGLASDKVVKVTPNATVTFTTTVAPAGATASIIVVTSGTTSYTITFGTGFLTTGTLATGTVTAKTFVVNFVSDGTTMIETSRTVAM